MKTYEEIREFLSTQFSKEKKRLKSYGTKTSTFDLANSVARHVMALMTESRHSELRNFKKKVLDKQPSQGDTRKIYKYINERLHATKVMKDAIENVAKDSEANRPWKSKKVKKHGHSRRTRISRH